MAKSIEQARHDVQSSFESARAWAESSSKRSFWDFERELWTRLLALGRALVVLFLVRAAARPRGLEYRLAGERHVIAKKRLTTQLGTRFGKVPFTRPVGRMVRAPRAARDLPVDRELGLCSGFSLGVAVAVTRLCAQMAFASARKTFAQFCEWMVTPPRGACGAPPA
jgi:hypothetical protein